MKLKNHIGMVLALSAAAFAGCTDDQGVAPLRRDTDAVELTYNADASTRVSVRYEGAWQARVECPDASGEPGEAWFEVSPASGVGNGRDYQYVTVTARRNPGDRRTGYLYLSGGGTEVAVEVSQADGHFSVADPVISGTLRSGTESAASLDIVYDKAFGGEQVEIEASLEGAAASGLQIESVTRMEIDREGSGTISVPITGTPGSLGDLVCRVKFSLDGEVKFEGEVQGSVSSSNELFRMGFDLFVWGGNYPTNQKGPGPNGSSTAGKEFNGTEPAEPDVITPGSDGTNDIFGTMTEEYRINRGVEKWEGKRVYEHPGYVKLGVTNNGGWIMTPELEQLSPVPETVVVSVDFLRFDNEEGTYIVSAEGAGTVLNGTVNAAVLPTQSSAADRKWKTLNFTVQNATNKTRIKICAESLDGAGYRINIDNVVVMGSDVVEVTEKLPAPDVEAIAYTPRERSIAVSWEGVKGATSYEISLAARNNPEFRKTVETSEVSYEFTDLEPGRYLFTVKALYAGNPKFDSDEAAKNVGTLGFPDEKLAVPTDLKVDGVTSTGATVTWSAVSGAFGYRVSAAPLAGGEAVETATVTEASYVFTKLRPGTQYWVLVVAQAASDPGEYDSDAATAEFTTVDPQPLIAPQVRIFAKTHGLAVLEWELSPEALGQQPVSGSDTYDFRVKNAAGEVIRSFEHYVDFNFVKYSHYRLVWGGLSPATTYTLEMRRCSTADPDLYLDSDWASVQVTTDAAPEVDRSVYLLYNDFEAVATGGQPLYGAYGFSYGNTEDFSDPDKILYTAPGSSNKNSIYCQSVKSSSQSYFDAYLPEWDLEDWSANSSNMGLAAGYMKFGGSSKPAWVTLPAFTSLAGPTELELDFDACSYYEPSSSGDMLLPSNVDADKPFYVDLQGDGTFSGVEGETSQQAVVSSDLRTVELRNVTAETMRGEGLTDTYRYTNHRIRISGATSSTRIRIYTALENDKAQHRMWLDNLKVRKAD